MNLSLPTIQSMVYDPTSIQKLVIDSLSNTDNLSIMTTTSPFVMLLEAATTTAAAAAIEARAVIRRKYPSLALTAEELYHHITDSELANMFAIPSKANIAFYINITDLKMNGYRNDTGGYFEITIPIGTEVTILDTVFTLLNDIIVRLYDNGTILVEQQANNNDLAVNDIGVISYGIESDTQSTNWIFFETTVKQIKRNIINTSISPSEGVYKGIPLTDYYCYSNVSYKNALTNNSYVRMNNAHNDEYIDPKIPTAYIAVTDTEITYKIPDVYLVDGNVSGNLKIEMYETKGKLYLPINKFVFSDFTVTLGDTAASVSAAATTNVAIRCISRDIVDGGTAGMSFTELRDSIIFNTTGDIDLPITNYQLARYSLMNGYVIYKASDVITERVYVGIKDLPSLDSNIILAKQDVYVNTATLLLNELTNNSKITINRTDFVIKSNTVFKEHNGSITIVGDDELVMLSNLSKEDKIAYFKTNKYFFTPYYYVIDVADGFTYSRIYDLDSPSITNNKIISKNNNLTQRVNINKYTMLKTDTGYRLIFTLASDNSFKDLDQSKIGIQLAIPTRGNEVNIYFNSTYNADQGYYIIDIVSDLFVSEDNYIDVKNGISTLTYNYINLLSNITAYVYTTETSVTDNSKFMLNYINKPDGAHYTVFSKEQLDVTFGTKIEYLWNKVYNAYTERKYKTYGGNVPKVYDTDVYETFDNGCIIDCTTDDNGVVSVIKNKLHTKGDIVLESDGTTVYKYKQGDIVLDDNDNPVIDTFGGIIRYVDILMLEYEYALATSNPYKNYLASCVDTLRAYLLTDLPALNNKLLENTNILYKSNKSATPVVVLINNVYYNMPYTVAPTVQLYITGNTPLSSDEVEHYKDVVGNIIDKHLIKASVSLSSIKEDVISTLGVRVAGVKITNLDSTNSELIVFKEQTNKPVLGKVLDYNKYGEYIVRYDIELTVQYI